MTEFSDILKTLRKERGWSQPDLAQRLGVSKSTISMYEQGRREPDVDTCRKIADIFQVDMDYLLGRDETSSGHFSPVTIAAHLDTYGLTDAELEDVADYIKFIRSKRKS